MEPKITNERAQREWLYILDRVGKERAYQAIDMLGNRKAFPLNIARILRLELPEERYLPELKTVKESRKNRYKQGISDLNKILGKVR